MSHISDQIWQLNNKELQTLLNSRQIKPKNNMVHFYAPSFGDPKNPQFSGQSPAFLTVSITGNNCALNCRHCGGQVLKTMYPATTPERLYELGSKFKQNCALGLLVSGGCLPDGSVPFDGYREVLGKLKHELELTVFVHTGIISPESALLLKRTGVDAALIDVVGSEETLQKTFNLNVNLQYYADSLRALDAAGLKIVPHVIVGLEDGKLGGEFEALQIIKKYSNPSAIVIIAFMPLRNTAMATTSPPLPLDIAKVAAIARQLFPATPITLGCMRPKGKIRGEIDVLALKAGVDAVAFPSLEAVEYAKAEGYRTVFSPFCCAQIAFDLVK